MDFEKNGQSSNNFVEKIKKQAKRLLKINQSQELKITSLSEAQELIAQLNGYPNWHALEKNTSSTKNVDAKLKELSLKIGNFDNEQFYFLNDDNYNISFLKINNITSNNKQTFLIFNSLKSFINDKIHDLSIYINNKTTYKNEQIPFLKVDSSFNISENNIKKLFFQYQNTDVLNDIYQSNLNIYIVIKTNKINKDYHFRLLRMILSASYNIEMLKSLNYELIHLFEMRNSQMNKLINKKFNEKILSEFDNIFESLLSTLHSLIDKKYQFTIKYSLNEKTINYKTNENLETFETELINSINSVHQNQSFEYFSSNKSIKNGATFKSLITNELTNYTLNSNFFTNNNFIYAKPGTGKSLLSSILNTSFLLENNIKKIPYLISINIYKNEQYFNLLKNIFPKNMQNIIKIIDIENNKESCINPFDLPLGGRNYNQESLWKITNLLLTYLTKNLKDYNEINRYKFSIETTIHLLNTINSKEYRKNSNQDIDKKLKELSFSKKKAKWFDVVDFLILNNEFDLAIKAQEESSPILSDYIELLKINKNEILKKIDHGYKNEYLETLNSIIDKLNFLVENYNCFNGKTMVDFSSLKIIELNLDKVYSFNSEISDYWFALSLNKIEKRFLNTMYNNNFDEIKDLNLKNKYEQYISLNNVSKHLVLDEFQRFSANKNIEYQVIVLLRESKKWNFGVTLISQLIFEQYSDCFSSFYINPNSINSSNIKDFDFLNLNNKNLELIQKTKGVFNYAVKKINFSESDFDIISCNVSTSFLFALSNNQDDLMIKNKLLEKYDYFNMIEKATTFLMKENSTTFYNKKNLVEKFIQEEFNN